MSVGRADDRGVRLARQAHVVRVAAEPLQEPRILQAADGLTDGELLDGDLMACHEAALYAARRRCAHKDLMRLEEQYPGLERVSVSHPTGTPEAVMLEQLEWFAAEVMPAFTKRAEVARR